MEDQGAPATLPVQCFRSDPLGKPAQAIGQNN